jgi:hypothetical protein
MEPAMTAAESTIALEATVGGQRSDRTAIPTVPIFGWPSTYGRITDAVEWVRARLRTLTIGP